MNPAELRIKELNRMPKWQLVNMHVANGGLMGAATYAKWTKDELVNAIIEDEHHEMVRSMTR